MGAMKEVWDQKKGPATHMALIKHKGAVKSFTAAPLHYLREPGSKACANFA